jgi:hypothetical protein
VSIKLAPTNAGKKLSVRVTGARSNYLTVVVSSAGQSVARR